MNIILSITMIFIYSGTDILSPHGMPLDLLDRIMIIRTLPYCIEDMIEVIRIQSIICFAHIIPSRTRYFVFVLKSKISILQMSHYKHWLILATFRH
jgi:hypothetical protein